MSCTWEKEEIKQGGFNLVFDGLGAGGAAAVVKDGGLDNDDFPGALHAGWDQYYEWANKDHEAWAKAFSEAECERIKESKRWLKYYQQVYDEDWGFIKKITMFALNAVQIWALWKQFRQQKEIADRTYEIADRTQKVAEELYAFYESTYQPHEAALGGQISEALSGRCVEYDDVADRFGNNVRVAFARAKANLMRCSSSHCGGITDNMLKQLEIEAAQAEGNARTGAYRWAELMKEHRDNFYLEMRMKFIQIGRGISVDGQNGIMKAFGTFSSFGADPGAALNQLLGTFSNTIGMLLNDRVAPNGQAGNFGGNSTFEPFMTRVMQSGDVQMGKVNVPLSKSKVGG